jgi:two-component system, NarL family, sensor histidine kinase UhpB
MSDPTFRARLDQRLRRYPILVRLLIGNAIVIFIGAVAGTVITRQVTSLSQLELILLFSGIGIFISLMMNYWVIYTALIPLRELRLAVDHFKAGDQSIPETIMMRADPDIHRLVLAINSMLERLDDRTRLLSALSERAINAQEEERKRIARALHDDTAQSISTLIIQLERYEETLNKKSSTGGDDLNTLHAARQLAIRILDDLRKNIWDLRPSILDDLGLCAAIRWYTRMCLGEAGIEIDFNLPDENIRLSSHLETPLFRITQEAVNNIIHHSDAQNVVIRLFQEHSYICLEIEDDGCGFDPTKIGESAVSRKRLGLMGMKERASLIGGTVQIESQPGKGTSIRVCVPLLEGIVFNGIDENSHMISEPGLDFPVAGSIEKSP